MSEQHVPLDKEALRQSFKKEKQRIEHERMTEELAQQKIRVDFVVEKVLKAVRKHCTVIDSDTSKPVNYFLSSLDSDATVTEIQKRLRDLNCPTRVTMHHSPMCQCTKDLTSCARSIDVVDFWNDPSPERNAQ